jgi:hypothetical protein
MKTERRHASSLIDASAVAVTLGAAAACWPSVR